MLMANEEHLAILKQGVEAWNAWRLERPDVRPDLGEANLSGADLRGADLRRVNLGGTIRATTIRSLPPGGIPPGGVTFGDYLRLTAIIGADLRGSLLRKANFSGAFLNGTNLGGTDLNGANLSEADLCETIFTNVDLSSCKGLESCTHGGPSVVDHRTLQRSGPLPIAFLRGVGLPDNLIDYLPSLLHQPIQFYSCFISYSSKDQAFADRLHADLQNKGVRCWFAPHDMPTGAKILDAIDEAVRLREKLLLVLSEHAIASDWVEDEVTTAFEEERKRKKTVLFPIRLDDMVMETKEAWAAKLRARNIGDFICWKEHDAYHKAFERLLRDLKVEATGQLLAG
jgi:hypothetical protein